MTHYYQWTQNNHKQIVSRSSQTNTHDISLLTNKASLETEPSRMTKLSTQKPTQLAGKTQAEDYETQWPYPRCELSSWRRRVLVVSTSFFNLSVSSVCTFHCYIWCLCLDLQVYQNLVLFNNDFTKVRSFIYPSQRNFRSWECRESWIISRHVINEWLWVHIGSIRIWYLKRKDFP
jgi:hypothetical protein